MQKQANVPPTLRLSASLRVVTGAAFLTLLSGVMGGAALAAGSAAATFIVADANFGSPPSGEVPILYNDRTVYARPDVLERARVLAALVKGGRIFVPLRSMFEQMGATVTVSDGGKTITATNSRGSASVTLGKAEVVINGETRPLDVPPMLYKGIVLVPVRVLSEALGAYVLWVPAQRVVVVRYIPTPSPTAPPTPAPTAAPTVAPIIIPTPAPTVAPVQIAPYGGFIQAAFAAPKTYNEFSAGQFCNQSYSLAAAYAFKNSPFAVKVDYRQYDYVTSDQLTDSSNNHYTSFATIDGGTGLTPVFLAKQSSLDARLEFQVAPSRINIGVSYLRAGNNYGYPQLGGVGFGIEKLPEMRNGLNFYGSGFYYPSASGNYTIANASSPNAGKSYQQQYEIAKFDVGLAVVFGGFPAYLYGGYNGEHYYVKQNAPIGQTHDGPYIGLGLKF
jgi:hypothetical protein